MYYGTNNHRQSVVCMLRRASEGEISVAGSTMHGIRNSANFLGKQASATRWLAAAFENAGLRYPFPCFRLHVDIPYDRPGGHDTVVTQDE